MCILPTGVIITAASRSLRMRHVISWLQVSEEIDTGIGCAVQRDHLYMIRNIMTPAYRPYAAVIVMDVDKDSVFQSIEGIPWFVDYDVSIDGQWIWEGTGRRTTPVRKAREEAALYHEGRNNAYVICERKMDNHVIRYVAKLDYDTIHYEKWRSGILPS